MSAPSQAASRLLEEWKAGNDLLKFYEDLKQKRFAHFLTIQTAFLAFFALLARDAIARGATMSLAALAVVAVAPILVSMLFIRIDTRSRALVDAINTRLLLLEREWGALPGGDGISTYRQLFAVLVERDADAIQAYLGARNAKNDTFGRLTRSRSAHSSEHAVLQLFLWLWVGLAAFVATLQALR